MKRQCSILTLMICVLVLAYVITFCKTANVVVSTTEVRRPTNLEFAIRLAWACPLVIAIGMFLVWIWRSPALDRIADMRPSFSTRDLIWLGAFVALLFAFWLTRSPGEPVVPGRYQLMNTGPKDQPLLFDTATGRIWQQNGTE